MGEQSFIPYGRQHIDQDDIDAVCAALQSDFLTCGPEIEAFENAFAQFVGAQHAVVVCNATAALHLAMLVAKVGPGDRVVTSPNTFVSSANCATFVGATPDFCDIDPATYTLCPTALDAMWTDDIKAVIPVAYAGQSANMPEIHRIAKQRGAIVIEDACHGTGGGFQVDGKSYRQGGHPWADITTFSFHPVKTLTTGEGGILVTDNPDFAEKARALRAHGITRDPDQFQGLGSTDPVLTERGPWYYEMVDQGYNFRITDFQCALGSSQLKKLPRFIARRRQIVARYNEAFRDLPWLRTPQLLRPEDEAEISWHLYTTLIDFPALGKTRTEVMTELREQHRVGSQVLYIPVYLQPWYRQTYGYAPGKCPHAEAYYAQALSLPLYPAMTDQEIDRVIAAVKALA
ncbi:MAG: UDP-4-amino-4,6-dideoxy-N-acetyl-beta-L-altrosamine transaminase [Verrucomicrobiaceae bacterium]